MFQFGYLDYPSFFYWNDNLDCEGAWINDLDLYDAHMITMGPIITSELVDYDWAAIFHVSWKAFPEELCRNGCIFLPGS